MDVRGGGRTGHHQQRNCSLCWLYTTQSSKQMIPSDGDDDAQGEMMDLHLLLHSTYSNSLRTYTPHTRRAIMYAAGTHG